MPNNNIETACTVISVTDVQKESIRISYNGLNGNQPKTYGNYIAIWEANSEAIPMNAAPLQVFAIADDNPEGSHVFSGLMTTKKNYLIGYAVGPLLSGGTSQQHGNVCASVFVQSDSHHGTTFNSLLTSVSSGMSHVMCNYNLPEGVQPKNNGACIGIWTSGSPSFNRPPERVVPITSNDSSGTALIAEIMLIRGASYVVGLFTSGYKAGSKPTALTTLAAWTRFST